MRQNTRLFRSAVLCAALAASARAELTFFTCSDTHYRTPTESNAFQTALIDMMNALPGKPYPAELGGGTVAVPRGVIVPGDLVDHGQAPLRLVREEWALWTADFGLKGEGRLKFPTYEGYGNHDLNGNFFIENAIKERNRTRADVVAISTNGFHYAWEWDGIHFVQLNLYPGNIRPKGSGGQPPRHALDFLREELKEHVGASGRPVVVSHHYMPTDTWWTDAEKDAYYSAIKDYNIVLIVHGHQGQGSLYDWRGLTVVNNNDFRGAGIFAVNIDDHNRMRIAQRKPSDRWGASLQKTIQRPNVNGKGTPQT